MPSGFTAKQYIMEQYKASLLKTNRFSLCDFHVQLWSVIQLGRWLVFSFNTLCKDLHVISQKPIVF